MESLKTILNRTWSPSDIHFWTNPKDGTDNASIIFDGKRSRLRAGIIILKGNKILLGEEEDEPGVFSLPGGSINKGETPIQAAIREAQEEVGITAEDVEYAGCDYCECHDEVKDWVRQNVPEDEWWYNYYTCLCIGQYKEQFKGKVDKVDQDKAMKGSARFYNIEDVIDEPSFKDAWKIALYNYGYVDDIEILKESAENGFYLNTAENYFNNKLDEKIVKKGSKWQVQSEKGRNMGTYDTEEEAKERLRQIEYFKHLNEEETEKIDTLTEAARKTIIAKAKTGDKYKNKKGNRWTAKDACEVAATVKDYNQIDMNTFWKQDVLTFTVPTEGETDVYPVTISFDNILSKIRQKVKQNKNLLEIRCIYDALIEAINAGNIHYSCECPDYNYRLRVWTTKAGDEAGRKENREAKITNPNNSKGPACKHILAVLNNVEWLKKIASVINNYTHYAKDNLENAYAKYIFPKIYGMEYQKAVQLTLDDFDEKGNLRDDIATTPEVLNLANALGKVRGRFKKGSNKNPASNKK